MRVFVPKERPESWSQGRAKIRHFWLVPLFAIEWGFEWIAYGLSNWKFLEVLEYLSSLSVLVAVIFYFSESGDRTKQRHYQAWQVINTAQGKGGSGGRIDALQELNADGVQLVGVDVSGASLQGINLPRAHLLRSNFSACDLRNSNFQSADFTDANLRSANFRESNLRKADFTDADLTNVDLTGAVLSGANFSGVTLDDADLRDADLTGLRWRNIASIKRTNLHNVKNAPPGFLDWAVRNGATTSSLDAPANTPQS
ncbi:MAG TPA: pentapeptide repeat-containing protein [Candidatus Acidoferrum sp.]|nr:pentapeptide repeat-containing protein [Candidatus Acidoferrum sp.]